MARAKRFNEVPVTEVREVSEFNDVKQRLNDFVDSNPEFFKYYSELTEEYNTKREAAEKATKSRQVSCGDFHLYQFQTKYDYGTLYQALGHESFLSVGGKIETVTKYDGDKTRIESSIASGVIPKQISDAVTNKSPRFHKPEKLSSP